jgi:hypothetical protein
VLSKKPVAGEKLLTSDFVAALEAKRTDMTLIKSRVLLAFRLETGRAASQNELSADEEADFRKWALELLQSPGGAAVFYRKKSVSVPLLSTTLSSLFIQLGQFHCPLCTDDTNDAGPIMSFPIRIKPESKQALAGKGLAAAFTRAIREKAVPRLMKKFERGSPVCIHLVFILGMSSRDKDVDNMAKALLDGLKRGLFEDDADIAHLSTMKLRHGEKESFILVSVRPSKIQTFSGVLLRKMHHSWAGRDEIRLEDFLDASV